MYAWVYFCAWLTLDLPLQPLNFRRGKMPSMHVHSSGSDASATSSAVAFYEAFLRSPNFMAWLKDRTEAMQNTTRSRYLHRLESKQLLMEIP